MKKKEPGNQWKFKMLILSIGEIFETSLDNYGAIWETRKRLQAQINWRWSIIIDDHSLIQIKRIENDKS